MESDRRTNWRFALLLALGIFAGFGAIALFWVLWRPMAVLVLNIAIADAFSPLVCRLERWMNRAVAAALLYLCLLALIGTAAILLGPRLLEEAKAILQEIPAAATRLQHSFRNAPILSDAQTLRSIADRGLSYLITVPLVLSKAALTAILTLFLSFYWLIATPSANIFVRSLFPSSLLVHVDRVLRELSMAMGGYLRGITLDALATGTLTGVGLLIAGVQYPLALGVITALGVFIPYIGTTVASIPAILIGLLDSPQRAVWAAVVYIGVQQIEGHLLTPNIMRSQTNVPQALVVIALFAGFATGGVLGALVAVPIVGAGKVLVESVVAPAIQRWHSEAERRDESLVTTEFEGR